MHKHLLTIACIFIATTCISQTATDFTVNDCNGNSHNLFTDLDAGKVIVLCWVMPCATCTGPAMTTYNVVQSYQTAHPDIVNFYLFDDVGNTSCTSLNTWATTNSIPESSYSLRFSNSTVSMSDYGSPGMPKIVVLGGASHTVYYNVNNTVDVNALQSGIDNALIATGINSFEVTGTSLNIFPNPVVNTSDITFNLNKSSDVRIELFDIRGLKLFNVYSGNLAAGENKIKIDLKSYAEGMYLVKVSSDGKSNFTKLLHTN